jgi:short-subunit dehydrogenase
MAAQRPRALVTGGSSGIGLELVKLFAADGYDVVVAADGEGVHGVAETVADAGVDIEPVQVDLRDPDGVERLYRVAISDGRTLDAAALNAGTARAGPFVTGPLDDDLGVVDLNVRSTVHLAKLVLTDMAARGAGRVLITSSIVAAMPGSQNSMYNASKSFVQSFATAVHDELRGTGVTVTALAPGPVDTDFFRRTGMLDTVLGRLPGKDDPRQVAEQGYRAMMRGEARVVAASPLSKATALANSVLPDSVKATANRLIMTPLDKRAR